MDKEKIYNIDGIDWNIAKHYQPDEKLLLESVRNFWKLCEDRAAELKKYYEEKDVNSYRILVHSMKSVSALIGAVSLSEMAKKLEDAAKCVDWNIIEEDTEVFLKEWSSFKDKLAVLFEDEKIAKQAIDDVNVKELTAKLDEIRDAADNFDIDLVDEVLEDLQIYKYEAEAKEIFEVLDKNVTMLDYSVVSETAMELKNYIIQKIIPAFEDCE